MYMKWHHLLFLHWRIDLSRMRGLVPDCFELDLWEGNAYLSLVLFTMADVRPRTLPPLPHVSAFHEFNVRTYVRHNGEPGVWFFSLDASNLCAVSIAKSFYGLPYKHAEMRVNQNTGRFDYFSRRYSDGAAIDASAVVSGAVRYAEIGTLDHFLVERYRLYSLPPRGLLSLDVKHSPYPLRDVTNTKIDESLSRAAGFEVWGQPLVHFADTVSVNVGPLVRV